MQTKGNINSNQSVKKSLTLIKKGKKLKNNTGLTKITPPPSKKKKKKKKKPSNE